MAFVINIADLNSQAVEATLDDVLFFIILNWNQKWRILDVRDL